MAAISNSHVFRHKIRVLELYSGIGGMHSALIESGLQFDVVGAADVNDAANRIYAHNFPHVKVISRGIEALSVRDWELLSPDLVTMSPPCQPFTRQGLKKDDQDRRCKSFLNILNILPKLSRKPSYLLIENVKGFEESETRERLIDTLKACHYKYQEFLLSPLQFGIPNQRLRYYLLASLDHTGGLAFESSEQVWLDLPPEGYQYLIHRRACPSVHCTHSDSVNEAATSQDCLLNRPVTDSVENVLSQSQKSQPHEIVEEMLQKYTDHCRPMGDFLVQPSDQSEITTGPIDESRSSGSDQSELLLDDQQMRRYLVLDIVTPDSKKSVCFTKSYSRQLDGCGSVLLQECDIQTGDIFADGKRFFEAGSRELEQVRQLRLRFFSPREVANLMSFPENFSFPASCSRAQRYRTLGNSLNCHVVSVLLRVLVSPAAHGDDR